MSGIRMYIRRAVVIGLAVLSVAAVDAPAQAASHGPALNHGDVLYRGDWIWRTLRNYNNQVVTFIMQDNGDLVLYTQSGRRCWASNTANRGDRAVYQSDGNFVIYSGNAATWASNTVGIYGNTVDINGEGAVYVGTRQLTGACHD